MLTAVDISQARKDGELLGMRDMADRIMRMIDDNKAEACDIHHFCRLYLNATEERVKEG